MEGGRACMVMRWEKWEEEVVLYSRGIDLK